MVYELRSQWVCDAGLKYSVATVYKDGSLEIHSFSGNTNFVVAKKLWESTLSAG